MKKKNDIQKKLEMNKETISNLTKSELSKVSAGRDGQDACWENIWTLYHCEVVFTAELP